MQHIYFVRHGTTQGMEALLTQGSTDSPLSFKGRKEAGMAAAALKSITFTAVFCSPLGRTRETAEIICSQKKTPVQIIEDLHEMDFGWLEGGAYFQGYETGVGIWERLGMLAKFIIAQLSGESLMHIKKRALRCWQEIQRRCPEGTILIVAHGVILNYLLKIILPQKQNKEKDFYRFDPCSITELILRENRPVEVVCLNGTGHLTDLKIKYA